MTEKDRSLPFPEHAVAIVGMAGRFPDADTLDAFWDNIRGGVESLESLNDDELDAAGIPASIHSDPNYVRKGTHLKSSAEFDAEFFGISPAEAEIIDPQQRLFLECAWHAMEHAGYGSDGLDFPVNIYAGTSMNTYFLSSIMANRAKAEAAGGYQLMLGNDKDFLCTRASYKLNLTGASITVQTACSTSLVAVEMACRALARGECDMALAGGVSLTYPERSGYLYQEGMIFSPDGHCRPFDENAKGTRAGAGVGIVTLKRLQDAMEDGDTIHAVIRGAAINNDGADKAGYTAPSIEGQVEAIVLAQNLAGVDPETIDYVEAHGTGTPLGDPIEIAALTQAFRDSTDKRGYCRLGSLKANIGHLDAAAGVAGLIKTVLCLKHKTLPPLVNFERANPKLELETSPFVASNDSAPWVRGAHPRRAGISSFGIGGTNAHVVLEEAPELQPADTGPRDHLLVVSARNSDALTQASQDLADALECPDAPALKDVSHTLKCGRKPFELRRHVVASTPAEAAEALRRNARGVSHPGGQRHAAFMFSGQGNQHPGMGMELYETEAAYRDAMDRCSEILRPVLNLDLVSALRADADADLNQTWLTQPALFAVEYALSELWRSFGVVPKAMIGHSIGEYVAAHLAGVMSLEGALTLVATRGQLMQEVAPGAMAAIELSEMQLRARIGDDVDIAAENGPEITVISGDDAIIAEVIRGLERDGVTCRRLHTSHAFHSRMMEPVLDVFKESVAETKLKAPDIPYVSNLTGDWITDAQAVSPDYYAQHLRKAVRFAPGLRTLAQDEALFLLEVGPGTTLSGLARMTLNGWHGRIAACQPHPKESVTQSSAILDAAGRMWCTGTQVDWMLAGKTDRPRRVPLPTYPYQRKRFWIEPDRSQPALFDDAPDAQVETQPAKGPVSISNPTWTMAPPVMPKTDRAGGWVVFSDNPGFGDAVVQGLVSEGIEHVRHVHLSSEAGAEDLVALFGELAEPLNTVIIALGTGKPASAPGQAYEILRNVGLAVEQVVADKAVRVVIQTAGACRVLSEPVRNPDCSIVTGPVLALNAESENIHLRQVDLGPDQPENAVQELVRESLRTEPELCTALRAGQRWHRAYSEFELNEDASQDDVPLRSGGVYLITGGLGGVGLTLARHMAERISARIVLTARSELPPRDAWVSEIENGHPKASVLTQLVAIEDAGAEIMVAALDASDVRGLSVLAEQVRDKWGRIDGIVHAAGVMGENKISALMDPSVLKQVLAPKVDGLRALAEVFGQAPLDFVVLMGSINSVLPAAGAMDYAAANAFLDVWPDSDECPEAWQNVVTFNWGGWADVGMAAQLRDGDEDLLDPDVAARLFFDGLASGIRRMVITKYDLPELCGQTRRILLNRLRGIRLETPNVAEGDPEPASALASAMDGHFETDLQRTVAAVWVELLGAQLEGPDDNFFELGGHSLMATRLISRLDAITSVKLTLHDVFDGPTIRELANRVEEGLDHAGGGDVSDEDVEEILI